MKLYSLQRAEFTPNLTFVYLGIFSTIDLAKEAAEQLNDNDNNLVWDDFEYDCRQYSKSKSFTGDIREPYFTIEEDYLNEVRKGIL